MSEAPDELQEIATSLRGMGLLGAGEAFELSRLSGGGACDVYRGELAGRAPLVVKRALPRLRVDAVWEAPPERAATEVAWIRLVAGIEPAWVPQILGEDDAHN